MVHVFCDLEDVDDGEFPMCDMTFDIVEKVYDEVASSWRLAFRADAAPYEPVGFGAIIPASGWNAQFSEKGDVAFFWGAATLQSLGAESDRLITLLEEYYEASGKPKSSLNRLFGRKRYAKPEALAFAQSIDCLAVGIDSNPEMITEDVIRMKLFFDDGVKGGRYAEIFLNIDLPRGLAALNEKDEDYRTDLVFWLSRPGHVNANPYGSEVAANK